MSDKKIEFEISAKLDNIDKQFSSLNRMAQDSAKKVEGAFSGIGSSLKTALAGAVSIGALGVMVKSVAEAGDQLGKLSTRTGVAVEELSKLQYAASLSDVSNEDLANSLGRLNRVLGEAADGSKEATAALARFGIAPGTLNASEAFTVIAERVKNTGDQTKIASAMNDIFGRSWQTLVPMIKGGADGLKQAGDELEKLGGVMSGELAEASERFNDNLTKIGTSLDALKIQSMGPVIQGLEALTAKFVEATKASGGFWKGMLTWGTTSGNQESNPAQAIVEITKKLNVLKEQKAGLEKTNYFGFLNTEDIAITNKQIDVLTTQLEYLKRLNTAQAGSLTDSWLKKPNEGITGTPTTPKTPKSPKSTKTDDPFADFLKDLEARIKPAEQALESFRQMQLDAAVSGADLTAAEKKFYDLINSPEWANMAEPWKDLVTQQFEAANATQKAADEQQRLNSLLNGLDSSKIEQAWQDMELLNKALANGKISQEQYSEATNKLFEGGSENIKEQKSLAEELGMTFSSAFEDAIVKGEEFSDVLDGLYQDILRILLRKNVTEPLTNALGSVNWGSLFSLNAKGNVYASPSLSAYSGGVYDSPHLFAFANGAGVFGEAGPEAIMPLSRTSDGKLGVKASGASGNVSVVINNNANGTQATQSTRQDQNGDTIIEVLIEQVEGRLSSGVSRGSGVFASSLERVYGLNRAAGAY